MKISTLEQTFQNIQRIGEGSFAQVKRAIHRQSRQKVAIKQIWIDITEAHRAQIDKLRTLKSDHIIQFKDYIKEQTYPAVYIIMELCSGNLRYLMKNKTFSFEDIVSFLVQITSAFLVLDQKKVMHLDLKPQNILYTSQGYFKICDFGCSQIALASKISIRNNKIFGTQNYLAPQSFLCQIQHTHVRKSSFDMWSLGIILYELVYKRYPFNVNKDGTILYTQLQQFYQEKLLIKYIDSPFTQEQNLLLVNLMKQMLRTKKRPNWKQLKHILIHEFDRHEIQFLDFSFIERFCISLSRLFFSYSVFIKEDVEHNICKFWQNNKTNLKRVAETLQNIIYINLNNLQYVFKNKWNKISRQKKDIFSYLRKSVLNQIKERSSLSQFQHNFTNLSDYFNQNLLELVSKLNIKLAQQQKWESIKTLQVFFEELMDNRQLILSYNFNFFLSPNKEIFKKTAKICQIELYNLSMERTNKNYA